MDTNTISDEIQQVIDGVGCLYSNNSIKTHSTLRYARRIIARVNKEEENAEGQKKKDGNSKNKGFWIKIQEGK